MAALRKPSELNAHPRLGPGGVLPPLSSEEYAGLKESIKTDGIMQPLVVTLPELVVIDGHHRLRIATELGMESVPVMYREVGDHASDFRLGLSLNLPRRQSTAEQKREAASELLRADPRQSDPTVARAVGLSHPTVARVRAEMEEAGELEKVSSRTGQDGKVRPSTPRRTGSKSNGGGPVKRGVSVPDLVSKIRTGMEMNGGRKSDEIAREIGIGIQTFREGRYVLMLADDPDLTGAERETVSSAVSAMTEDGQVARAFSMVEPLVTARWGSPGDRKGPNLDRIAKKRTDDFMRAYGAVVQVCSSVDAIEIPLLSPDRAEELSTEIDEAIKHLRKLQKRIKEAR